MSNLTTKRSRRFLSSKYPTMELESIQKPRQVEEIFHFSHPYHPLVQITLPRLFTCSGCKEYGAGKRFKCRMCEFCLHDFCALAPPSLQNHPLHQQHQLVLFPKPGGIARSKCNICAKTAKGYAFRCTSCGFVLHPCCATMHTEMAFPTHQHSLTLLPPFGGNSNFACEVCRRKRLGRVYCCLDCGYHLHAVCAKEVINGLYMHGIKPPAKKTNMLGAAGRVAGHAFFEIIGGLIEGIGEGIGEALMDSIGRSRNTKSRKKKITFGNDLE